ncbi:MAG: glycogen debranching enzyme N-terminal domain-containing protein [Rikenellaceae bacterium]
MAALTFDKNELGNLEYSLQREMLATDRRGGYMSTTIVGCNTRKYHGLMVSPIDGSGRDYVLLSSLDETIIRDDQRFNLALHRFKGVYEPRGHKYMTDFVYTPCPTMTYRVGDVVLRKELLWIHKRTQLMVRYTLVEGGRNRPVTLQLRPFLAFRDRHALSKANLYADGRSQRVTGGVKCRLYDGFPWLYMQTSKADVEFVSAPDWYYDFEYQRELERGYESHEDLLTPGYFELDLKFGESVIFSASTDEMFSGETIKSAFEASIARRTHKIDFKSCLEHSARQFVVRAADGRVVVNAGYPWYGVVGRDTMMALPGLTITQGHKEDCIEIMDSLYKQYCDGVIDESFLPENAVDASLWGVRVIQMIEKEIGRKATWDKYRGMLTAIVDQYRNSMSYKYSLHDNGLIWAWSDDKSMTWMDYTEDSSTLKPRNGYQVEVNALWYNAVSYLVDLAKEFKDRELISTWGELPAKIKESFISRFWMDEGWLADYVNNEPHEVIIRPNMIVACALDYKMLTEEQQVSVIRVVNQHLLTPRGLRSLSPRNPLYNDKLSSLWNNAPKNGSVWVFPLLLYVKSCFDIMGDSFLPQAEEILEQFNEEIQSYGIGSIGEYFEADPPHQSRGAISQATSVAAVLEVLAMVESRKAAIKPKRVTRARATKSTTIETKAKSTAKKSATTTTKAKATTTRKRVAKPKAE